MSKSHIITWLLIGIAGFFLILGFGMQAVDAVVVKVIGG